VAKVVLLLEWELDDPPEIQLMDIVEKLQTLRGLPPLVGNDARVAIDDAATLILECYDQIGAIAQ
jgi:hypothetical protein